MRDELSHHGIKGQKWGVRRTEKQLAKLRNKSKNENWSSDATETAEIRLKKVKQMSNNELRKINERLQLERTYSELSQRTKSRGQKFVSDVIEGAAKDTAKSYVSKGMKAGVSAGAKAVTKKRNQD